MIQISLPVDLDSVSRKRLVLLRRIYQRGIVDARSRHSDMSRLTSLIEFDLAIEAAMRAVVASLAPSRVPPDTFPGLVQKCDSLLAQAESALPDRASIQHVHALRNDAQHKAKYPSVSEIEDCRTYSRDALSKLCRIVWDIDFERIALAEVIRDNSVRALLQEAQRLLDEGASDYSLEKSGEAMELAMRAVRNAVVGPNAMYARSILVEDNRGNAKPSTELLRAFRRMQDRMLFMALGLDHVSHLEFVAMAGEVRLGFDGKMHHTDMREHPTREDAEYALVYAGDAIAQIEERVGDLAMPFGRDWRL